MNCPLQFEETADILLDYSARRLDAAKAAGLEQHMAGCPDCRSYRMDQTAVWDALDLWEPAPISVDFNRRLWHRIDAAAATPWYRTWYRDLAESLRFADWKPVLPLSAAILAIAAGFLLDHPAERVADPGSTLNGVTISGVTANEAEQVEQTLDDIQLLHQLDAVAAPSPGSSKSM